MLLFGPHVALLLLHFGIKGAAYRKTAENHVITAILGEQLTLDCTYNCSSGFIRGIWKWEDVPACGTCSWTPSEKNMSEEMCIVSLQTLNLTLEQTMYNYSCYSVESDHRDLPHNLEQVISLQIKDKSDGPVIPRKTALDVALKVTINQNQLNLDHFIKDQSSYSIRVRVGDKLQLKCLSNDRHCEGQWMRNDATVTEMMLLEWSEITEETEGTYTCHTKQLCTNQKINVVIDVIKNDELGWIRPLAASVLSVAAMLLFLLIYLRYRKSRKNLLDADDTSAVIYENTRNKNDAVIHKPMVEDSQSDHEVPYADIVISVRGSSIPELTGSYGQTQQDHRLRWREEVSSAFHLQACRSADRLHVHPREVSRKLSTTSEYAVITYSTDALH